MFGKVNLENLALIYNKEDENQRYIGILKEKEVANIYTEGFSTITFYRDVTDNKFIGFADKLEEDENFIVKQLTPQDCEDLGLTVIQKIKRSTPIPAQLLIGLFVSDLTDREVDELLEKRPVDYVSKKELRGTKPMLHVLGKAK